MNKETEVEKILKQIEETSEVINENFWYVDPDDIRNAITEAMEEGRLVGYQLGLKRKPITWSSTLNPTEPLPQSVEDIITTHDTQLWEKLEGMKGEWGTRSSTFKEGYKSGYNAAITDAQKLIKDL